MWQLHFNIFLCLLLIYFYLCICLLHSRPLSNQSKLHKCIYINYSFFSTANICCHLLYHLWLFLFSLQHQLLHSESGTSMRKMILEQRRSLKVCQCFLFFFPLNSPVCVYLLYTFIFLHISSLKKSPLFC